MSQQYWPSFKRINDYLWDDQSVKHLQNGLRRYLTASHLAPFHTLYNVGKLVPLFQGYATLLCSSPRSGSYLIIIYDEICKFWLCLIEKLQLF